MKRKLRICLLSVTSGEYVNEAPLNLLYLAGYLLDKKIIQEAEIKIIDAVADDPVIFIERFQADVVGLSVITPFYPLANEIAMRLKEKFPSIVIVIGGYHISALPRSLEFPFDYAVIGEGEATFAELILLLQKSARPRLIQLRKINGLSFINRKTKEVVVTNPRAVLRLANSSPLPWHLIPPERIFQYQLQPIDKTPTILKSVRLYTSRGCPYNCSFCAHRVVWNGVRFYDAKLVGSEIEHLYKTYGINSFQIMDDTFAISKIRLKTLIEELKNRQLLGKVYFHYLFVRANLIDDEFAKILKEFGAISVFIGIEFGSERMLRLLKDGELSMNHVKKSMSFFRKYKINAFGSFMLFGPTETKIEMNQTYKIAKWFVSQPNALMLGFSVTTPYPGTKLWDIALKEGIVQSNAPNWQDYLMFDVNSGTRDMTKIFFYNGLSDQDCIRIWQKFSVIYEQLIDQWESTPQWKQLSNRVSELNIRNFYKMLLFRRFSHLLNHPDYYYKKVIQSPRFIVDKIVGLVDVLADAKRDTI